MTDVTGWAVAALLAIGAGNLISGYFGRRRFPTLALFNAYAAGWLMCAAWVVLFWGALIAVIWGG
jgi:hypothetical protein